MSNEQALKHEDHTRCAYGCAPARNKGTCGNRKLIKRERFEARILKGLKHNLLHPDLIAEFTAEYQRDWHCLHNETTSERCT